MAGRAHIKTGKSEKKAWEGVDAPRAPASRCPSILAETVGAMQRELVNILQRLGDCAAPL